MYSNTHPGASFVWLWSVVEEFENHSYKEKKRCPMFGLHDKQTNTNTKVFNAGFTADTKTH